MQGCADCQAFFLFLQNFFWERDLLTAIFLKRCGMLFGQRDINFFNLFTFNEKSYSCFLYENKI